ncbi:MAG: hypothetical protein ACE5Q6_22895 [Dehalococcoidia bacterium]
MNIPCYRVFNLAPQGLPKVLVNTCLLVVKGIDNLQGFIVVLWGGLILPDS